ncbi:acyltransferase family protein [Endozoicomonas sp. SM1973]|uniref:Acyltransferase family protein n=1 Tax=Spartinivicinus marinus TaxID=2994442 RepID=A0A853I623_9GAMM|nr:acyltransferase family protein [Spartinivicinus marinus]MCX4028249.1 acyltransferase family protein [Spartinivicinus marinus]NYZ65584.1 acyltransferase family protein [Spartinivicinus marinus]
MQQDKEIAFDLMRCIASIGVVAIHVISPYRQLLNEVPLNDWLFAVSVDGFFRWAVPIFIMISGALLLHDSRPFNLTYYTKRRLLKVFIPFLVWSIFYLGFSGLTYTGFNPDIIITKLQTIYKQASYYHLGFFYYFIPLYFVIPLLRPLAKSSQPLFLYLLLLAWLTATGCHLFYFDGAFTHKLVLYSGYLLFGYLLWQHPIQGVNWLLVLAGLAATITTIAMVVNLSVANNDFTVGRWLSYKTLNRVLIAGMVFVVFLYCSRYLKGYCKKFVCFVSQYSLGLYFIHPIFLWPLKEYALYFANPLLTIFCWVSLAGGLALLSSWLLGRNQYTKWLAP